MRPHNSVGGYRIWPSSPADAEDADRAVTIIAMFNEAKERLRTQSELTERERMLVDTLEPNSQLARDFRSFTLLTSRYWQNALENQNIINQHSDENIWEIHSLEQKITGLANLWERFKRQLHEQA